MSGWEKYVEQAAEAIDPAAFDQSDPIHAGRQRRRDAARSNARVALAVVGPLIQEDTRDRMVTAAAASLDRAGGSEQANGPAIALLQDFIDPDPCWYDHHGYCQAHGWLDDDPACPHARARKLLAEMGIEVAS